MSYKLCRTCAKDKFCSHKTAHQTIVDCLEFHGTGDHPGRDAEEGPQKTAQQSPTSSGEGLCVNCNHRTYCTHTDSSQFVMQCEEYV